MPETPDVLSMAVDSHRGTEIAESAAALVTLISPFDSKGGGEYWISRIGSEFPCLAMRFTGIHADVHWFGDDQGNMYRSLRPDSASQLDGECTRFIFEHSDPSTGEDSPNQFVIPRETAFGIARSFFESTTLPSGFSWYEL